MRSVSRPSTRCSRSAHRSDWNSGRRLTGTMACGAPSTGGPRCRSDRCRSHSMLDQLDAAEAVSSHPLAALRGSFAIRAARPGERAACPCREVAAKVPGTARIREPHRRALADYRQRTARPQQSPRLPEHAVRVHPVQRAGDDDRANIAPSSCAIAGRLASPASIGKTFPARSAASRARRPPTMSGSGYTPYPRRQHRCNLARAAPEVQDPIRRPWTPAGCALPGWPRPRR